MRAETYVNLYSLSVEHFNDVLERYPLMRRTMESVAAERLAKIGKNPSLVSSRADLEDDQKLVNEIVMESTPIPTSASEDEDRDSDESSDGSKQKKRPFKFDFATRLHKISEEKKRSRENLKEKDLIDLTDQKQSPLWTKLPKVYSGSNLFGLRVPGFPERKRSGSVGDAYSLGSTRQDSIEEEGSDARRAAKGGDEKRRASFLSARLFRSPFDPRGDVRPKKLKETKTPSQDDPRYLAVPGEGDSSSKDSPSPSSPSKSKSKERVKSVAEILAESVTKEMGLRRDEGGGLQPPLRMTAPNVGLAMGVGLGPAFAPVAVITPSATSTTSSPSTVKKTTTTTTNGKMTGNSPPIPPRSAPRPRSVPTPPTATPTGPTTTATATTTTAPVASTSSSSSPPISTVAASVSPGGSPGAAGARKPEGKGRVEPRVTFSNTPSIVTVEGLASLHVREPREGRPPLQRAKSDSHV